MVQMTSKNLKDLLAGMTAEQELAEDRMASHVADLAGAGWTRVDLPGRQDQWVGVQGSKNLTALRARLDWEAKRVWGRDGTVFLMVPRHQFVAATADQAHRVLEGLV